MLKSRRQRPRRPVDQALFWLARFPRTQLYRIKIKYLCDEYSSRFLLRREKCQPRQLCA
uniref:Uncharacterized protein n=1 Tax=Ralstonia solanacearum TaxID=305 RepID=A0A0S4TNI4_RALSL|nr:protein of unknown function [Ralstonia solanacearum]